MRVDDIGYADVCRVKFTPVGDQARDLVTDIKQLNNKQIAMLQLMQQANPDPAIKRLFAIAITELEGGTMWAVKALTSEGLICPTPRTPPPPPLSVS